MSKNIGGEFYLYILFYMHINVCESFVVSYIVNEVLLYLILLHIRQFQMIIAASYITYVVQLYAKINKRTNVNFLNFSHAKIKEDVN